MSVIGRLDKQVEEIIINPLARRAPGGKESNEDSSEQRAAVPKGEDDRREETLATPARDDKEQELPVWLL